MRFENVECCKIRVRTKRSRETGKGRAREKAISQLVWSVDAGIEGC